MTSAWPIFSRASAGLFVSRTGKPATTRGSGRPAYPSLLMFKVLLLQSLYGLSDAEMEEALGDRLSFRRFVGLSLTDAVPDHTTICRFRNLLVEYIQRVVETQIGRALLSSSILDGATIRLDSDANAEELLVTWRNPGAGPSTNGAEAATVEDTETVRAGSPG